MLYAKETVPLSDRSEPELDIDRPRVGYPYINCRSERTVGFCSRDNVTWWCRWRLTIYICAEETV